MRVMTFSIQHAPDYRRRVIDTDHFPAATEIEKT